VGRVVALPPDEKPLDGVDEGRGKLKLIAYDCLWLKHRCPSLYLTEIEIIRRRKAIQEKTKLDKKMDKILNFLVSSKLRLP
jgi:hypothetical protein